MNHVADFCDNAVLLALIQTASSVRAVTAKATVIRKNVVLDKLGALADATVAMAEAQRLEAARIAFREQSNHHEIAEIITHRSGVYLVRWVDTVTQQPMALLDEGSTQWFERAELQTHARDLLEVYEAEQSLLAVTQAIFTELQADR